jgi:ABC-type bacteriocin/lantibiotic exporter with double-glycine peptidase domain
MSAGTNHLGAHWRLQIRDLTFRHGVKGESAPVLDRVHVALESGKRYALVGSSGSGKSTLLRVLGGLYAAERIALDIASMPAMVNAEEASVLLRSVATLIPQDAQLFEGTLSENLALCRSLEGEPSIAQYPHAIRVACVDDFVAADTGLDCLVAEGAANWSGGQRARFALARGILAARGSALLLLDEPTASLDPRTESRVYDNLFDAFPDACIVSSIHRLELLHRFDEVIVMRDGRVVEQGPPALLLRTSDHLRQLARLEDTADEGRYAAA